MNAPTFYVVLWNYSDNSGFGVVGVRETCEQAEQLVKFLRLHGDTKQFSIHETDMEPK